MNAEVHNWLIDDEKRKLHLDPFGAFKSFVVNYTGMDHPDYASVCEWGIRGKKIALIGINSAWMCGRNKDSNNAINDKGFTLVGEPQIPDLLRSISDVDIKIVVLHHPFNWLADLDCIKGRRPT